MGPKKGNQRNRFCLVNFLVNFHIINMVKLWYMYGKTMVEVQKVTFIVNSYHYGKYISTIW